MLCSRCEKVFSGQCDKSLNEPGLYGEWYVLFRIDSLFPTLEHPDCQLCFLIARSYRNDHDEAQLWAAAGQTYWGWETNPVVEYDIGPFDPVLGFKLSLRLAVPIACGTGSTKRRDYSIMAFHRRFDVMPAELLQEQLQLRGSSYKCMSDSTDDESCWDLFQKWLQQCRINHELCRLRSHPRSWYPTRLLRISDRPIKDPWTRMIRLHITAEEEMAGPYMTVSHCWGGEVPTTLTEETMGFLKAGLMMQDLPKTFTDAVRIVAFCGVEYPWIDSLCIIQGSEEDWRKEASMMGKVYSNSFCNIAATGSPNPNGGFFHPRDPMDVQPIEVKATWACETADTYEGYSESPPPGDYICFDTNYWIRGLDNSPLGKRAWAVQERYLAPRQVHFGQEQIFWECREHAACEAFPGGAPLRGQTMPIKTLVIDTEALTKCVNDEFDVTNEAGLMKFEAVYAGWDKVVGIYSRCELTFGRDKLVSISGLAEIVRAATCDEYLAGLWKKHLPSQLLWRTTSDRRRNGKYAVRPRPLRAPTWSWASMEADISCLASTRYRSCYKPMLDILDASVTPVAGSTLGEVKGGELRVRGALYRATIYEDHTRELDKMTLFIGATEIDGSLRVDESPFANTTSEESQDQHFYCLPVLSGRYTVGAEMFWLHGLILKPVKSTQGEFERFGYFDTRSRSSLEVFEQPCDNIAEPHFNGSDRQAVTIAIR